MANRNLNTPEDKTAAILEEGMGGCGAVYVTSDAAATGNFSAFTVIADGGTVTTEGEPTLTTVSVPTGVTIFGRMTSISCTAGTTVVAYRSCR
jgi:hypothetical protein